MIEEILGENSAKEDKWKEWAEQKKHQV